MNRPVRLHTPLDASELGQLAVGAHVLLSGTVVTARDAAHRYLVEAAEDEKPPFDLEGGVIYHCGPIIEDVGEGHRVVSAGPTTSMRMEMYEPRVIERYGVRAVMGKGGMGEATANALQETGGVYLAAPSGAGALLAKRIIGVSGVWKLDEFGTPEALWQFEVSDFPAVVAMDARGGNLFREVERASADALSWLLGDRQKE